MKDRAFGVELEFSSNGIGSGGIGDLLLENSVSSGWYGERRIDEYYGNYYYTDIGSDGSEIELRSPILEGKRGFEELKKVVDLLNREGCYTTVSDGLHVHHNAPEFVHNKELVVKLLKSWKFNESHISSFVTEDRRQAAECYEEPCPSFDYESIVAFENSSDTNRYLGNLFTRNNLNVIALNEHGSIEFRYHEGTLDWDNIEAWVRFGQSFLNSVVSRKNPIAPANNPVVLMNRLKTNRKSKVFLAKKAGLVAA